ncbi:hypothetical protein FO526_14640, partial [Bacillus thuringiensis]|nr:hypothetical protein [Bacillus thuringiensis]
SFFIGLFLIKVFAVDFKLLPIGGMIDVGSNSTGFAYVIEVAKHMILPVFILTLLGVGSHAHQLKNKNKMNFRSKQLKNS